MNDGQQGRRMDVGVDPRQERFPESGKRRECGFSYAGRPDLRASFAVRAASAAKWVTFTWPRKARPFNESIKMKRFEHGPRMYPAQHAGRQKCRTRNRSCRRSGG